MSQSAGASSVSQSAGASSVSQTAGASSASQYGKVNEQDFLQVFKVAG